MRATESVFKPGEMNPMEPRGERITRVLKGSTTIERTHKDGKAQKLEWKEGGAYYYPADNASSKNTNAAPTHPIVHMLQGDGWHVLKLYGLACVFAPLLEEAMFRGALFHHLRRRWNWLISATIVALLFAIIHPQGWTLVPTLGAIAIVLAALREWRGSLLASITAHATNNFIVLTIALLVLR